jgi:hypothetical protein
MKTYREWMNRSVFSWPRQHLEGSGQLHTSADLPGTYPPVPSVYEAVWAPERTHCIPSWVGPIADPLYTRLCGPQSEPIVYEAVSAPERTHCMRGWVGPRADPLYARLCGPQIGPIDREWVWAAEMGHCIRGCVGPREVPLYTSLCGPQIGPIVYEAVWASERIWTTSKKNSWPYRNWSWEPSVAEPVASLYTDIGMS